MKKILIFGIIILLILGVGCNETTPNNVEPPTTNNVEPPSQSNKNLTVSFIDVGQGDSILIQYQDQDMLIDCGDKNAGQKVSSYLKSRKVDTIEYLIITHADADHIGGCKNVLSDFTVKKVFLDGQEKDTSAYKDTVALIDTEEKIIAKGGFEDNLGSATWEILQANTGSEDTNQNSIVIRMDYYNQSFLFTGDCDRDCEKSLLDKNIDVDFLKVAHHCSQYGTTEEVLQKITPKLAFIQVAKVNKYGHPTQECLNNLANAGVEVHRNDLEGDIVLVTDGNNYWLI
jgi:competence protein ComEC